MAKKIKLEKVVQNTSLKKRILDCIEKDIAGLTILEIFLQQL